jgi:NAD(P)-dependent dehydrogenase (short-subunit alcohol dehydrogenase family)
MNRLQHKTALVTGGRQGIGRAIVDRFVAEGARVMTCGRGPRPDDLPPDILWQTADVSAKADVDRLTDAVVAEFGELAILVNNAGVQIEKTIVETTDQDWDLLMGVNDPAAAKQDALARHPAGRLGEPGDIASLAAWLASDEAGFATGQCYTLDGGMTAASPLNPGLF